MDMKRGPELTAVSVHALLNRTDPFIVEIGANDGETTQSFIKQMPYARIVAFEPDPRPLSRFMCKDDLRVKLHPIAISDRYGMATFYQSGGVVGHLERDHQVTFPTQIQVETRLLDDFLWSFPEVISLIWCDCQGAEARVILGGQYTLRRTQWLYMEYYDTEQYLRQPDLKALLSFLPDWDLIALCGDNALLRNRTVE